MSQKKNTAPAAETVNANAETVVSDLAQTDSQQIAAVDSFDNVSFDFGNENQVVEVSAEYLKMEAGQIENFIYTGASIATFEGEEKTVVNLLSRNKESFIAANVVLVNTLKKLQAPCLVRIACVGKVGTGSSSYTGFKVFTIPQNIARPEPPKTADTDRQLTAAQ